VLDIYFQYKLRIQRLTVESGKALREVVVTFRGYMPERLASKVAARNDLHS